MRLLAGLLMLVIIVSGCIATTDPRSLEESTSNSPTPALPPGNENGAPSLPPENIAPTPPAGDTNTSSGGTITTPPAPTPVETTPAPTTITLSASEIAKHATKKNCWVIYEGGVYDVSAYTSHPGGNVYVPYCGKDMTKAYNQQGHSGNADRILGKFWLGKVGDSIPA